MRSRNYSYNASGVVQNGTQINNAVLYTGRYYDAVTGNYFYRARYYSPYLGRFISRDPLSGAEFSQGTNLYAYCENNYTDLSDPTGDSWVQGILDAAGLIPVVQDFTDPINAAISLSQGDYKGAGLSIAGMVPFVGEAADAAKAARDALEAAKEATEVAKTVAKDTVRSAATARGKESEKRVLKDLGLPSNNTKVTTAEGASVPDALTSTLSVEVKDSKSVSMTKQLRVQTGAAADTQRQSVRITGKNTIVSGPVKRAFDQVIQRDDLGPQK